MDSLNLVNSGTCSPKFPGKSLKIIWGTGTVPQVRQNHLGNGNSYTSSPKSFGEQGKLPKVTQNYLGNGKQLPKVPKKNWGTCHLDSK